jgi:hypothetical protein
MSHKIRQMLVYVVVLAVIAGVFSLFWTIFRDFFQFLREADANVVAALFVGSATIIASIFTVVLGQFFARGREIADAHREKKTQIYAKFLQQMVQFLRDFAKEDSKDLLQHPGVEDFFYEFHTDILLWASPRVIRTWLHFRNASDTSKGVQTLIAMDNLIRAMRADLGLGNRLLSKGDLIKVLLSDPHEMDAMVRNQKN